MSLQTLAMYLMQLRYRVVCVHDDRLLINLSNDQSGQGHPRLCAHQLDCVAILDVAFPHRELLTLSLTVVNWRKREGGDSLEHTHTLIHTPTHTHTHTHTPTPTYTHTPTHTKVNGEGAPLLAAGVEVCVLHVQVPCGDRLGPQPVEQGHCRA